MGVFREVDPKSPVNEREEMVLAFWKKNDIANQSVKIREGSPKFIFYEGPPTANGLPGIHHVLARTIKDIACRYKTMQGYQVSRKAGWDTHGLPVEIEVEKRLGLSSKKDIEDYGIRAFNQECRDSVFSYEKEWRRLTERIGYWIDMDNPYVTLDNDYVETVWWILKRFFDAGLIYEGHKILPYCPRCGTPLASHEVALGYKDETIDSIYVKMKVKGRENEYLLVWTTTPWTLPSNVGIAVNPDNTYVRAQLGEDIYYIVEERLLPVLGEDAVALSRMSGKELEYLEYEQLFPFVEVGEKAFYVVLADYVSTQEGTGLVHIAPAFGEDDYKSGQKYGLPMLQLVDEEGKFVPKVTLWAGRLVKQADSDIIRTLNRENKLYKRERMTHSYPFCWRCDTPLLYYARKSWYIATTQYRDKIIEANKKITWYPRHVGTGRFGDWLENMVDWAISRNRYWGTPLNIWKCPKCGKLESVGSREELSRRSLTKIDPNTIDLHRPFVDEIQLECSCGGVMSRTPEVIDCWFDSGSMPYGQMHYPFEHKDDFENHFPADFIAEGLDQTRGWFYSLVAISTFLFDQPAFKRVLVNDLVLDKNGSKMSKSRGNAVNPWDMIDSFGVDALRWYFMAVSPPWVPTRFDSEGVKEVAVRFFGTLQNVYSFFTLYANIDDMDPREISIPLAERPEIDRWVLSRYASLCKEIETYMESYDYTRTVRAISEFVVDQVSNWYVRRSRERFWSVDFDVSKKSAYRTLYEVLLGVSKLMAPFAPFMAESMYQNLTQEKGLLSVHFEQYPVCQNSAVDRELEARMGLVIELVSLGRSIRNKVQIKVRQPLRKILVNGKHKALLKETENLVREELNVKQIVYVDELQDYVLYDARPNLPVAGPKYQKRLGQIREALASKDASLVAQDIESKGFTTLSLSDGLLELAKEDVEIRMKAKPGFSVEMDKDVFVVLDTEIDEVLMLEGIARELVSKVQTMRKSLDFNVLDHISMDITCDATVRTAIERHEEYIKGDTLCDHLRIHESQAGSSQVQEWDLNGHQVWIGIER